MEKNSLKPSEKYLLNVHEAAQYFGIGEKMIRQIIKENGYDVLIGKKVLINRKLMEKYLDDCPHI